MRVDVHIKAIREEADGIWSFDLRSRHAQRLPEFDAGAHIDVFLPGGLVRSYSLCNSCDGVRYVVAVNKDPKSRGGSQYMHEGLRVGADLVISAPRNNFPLDPSAPHSVLIAGGIGITPILAMARTLAATGRSWELHYGCRASSAAAFTDELVALQRQCRAKVDFCFGTSPDEVLDLAGICESAPDGSHFYCCGPPGMLAAFEDATSSLPPIRVHTEHFAATVPAAKEGGFEVRLARSRQLLRIAKGSTILEAVLEAGVDVGNSCREGVCGMCETTVICGVPDHRDLLLSTAERAANKSMMICCSGSLTDELVLDL